MQGRLRDAGIATARSITLRDHACDPDDPAVAARIGAELGWPVFVNPATLGSSVGISKVAGPTDRRRARTVVPARPQDPRRGARRRPRARMRRARQRACGGLGRRRDRPGRRLVRLRRQVRRGRFGDRDPRAARRGDDRRGAAHGARGLCRLRVRRHGPCRLLPAPGRRAAAERGQHHPGLHRHVRVRAPVRRDRRVVPAPGRPPRRASRSSATPRAAATGSASSPLRSSPPRRRTRRSAAPPRSWPSIHPGRPRAA